MARCGYCVPRGTRVPGGSCSRRPSPRSATHPSRAPSFTEDDWTDPDTPGLAPYPRSKAIAERAAWEEMSRDGGDTELVVVNPTGIFGPTLTTDLRSSMQLIKAMLDGTMSVAPRQRFGIVDVRDVADLHLRAMAALQAAGRRYPAVADEQVP